MGKMSVDEAVAHARGDEFDGSTAEEGPSMPPESGGSGGESIIDRLFDGNLSGPPLAEFKHDYGFTTPRALMLRGVARVAPGDGVPPIGEMLIGGFLEARQRATSAASEDNDNGQGAASGSVKNDTDISIVSDQ